MAKRKKASHPKKRAPRRRRMGSTGHHGGMFGNLEEIGGMIAGSVIAAAIQRRATNLNPKILAIGGIVGGMLLKSHSSAAFMQGAGNGIITVSGVALMHDVGVIHGVENMVSGLFPGNEMSGYIDGDRGVSFPVQGIYNDQVMSGMPNELRVSPDSGNYRSPSMG